MEIHELLKEIEWKKREYFKYKFPDVRYDQTIAPKTEKEFLKIVDNKSINTYLRWEKTEEYKGLMLAYIQFKMNDDLYDIYEAVSKNAKKGEDKSVITFIKLKKEIEEMNKVTLKALPSKQEEVEDDELDIN
jgi:hypothetical protein